MRVIRIEESKKEKMSGYAEKALKSMGKLMQCIEELGEDEYGDRDDDWDEDDFEEDDVGQRGGYRMRRENTGGGGGSMGQRRSRRTGRFIR